MVVHGLRQGWALCGMAGRPAEWEGENYWVWADGGERSSITCEKCLEALKPKPLLPDAVIFCPGPLSALQAEQMKAAWSSRFSGELLILSDGMGFEVINGRVRSIGDGIDALWSDGP